MQKLSRWRIVDSFQNLKFVTCKVCFCLLESTSLIWNGNYMLIESNCWDLLLTCVFSVLESMQASWKWGITWGYCFKDFQLGNETLMGLSKGKGLSVAWWKFQSVITESLIFQICNNLNYGKLNIFVFIREYKQWCMICCNWSYGWWERKITNRHKQPEFKWLGNRIS